MSRQRSFLLLIAFLAPLQLPQTGRFLTFDFHQSVADFLLPTPPLYSERSEPTAATVLAEDQGKFRLELNGQPVGTEEFQISPDGDHWVARGKVQLALAGRAPERQSARLDLAADGTPLHYAWSAEGKDKRSLAADFQGATAKMTLRKGSVPPFVQQFSFATPRVVILDNNMYHHYGILARLYDWNTRGPQNFQVFIPQEQLPGTVTVESLGPRRLAGPERGERAGANYELLQVRTADLVVNLFLDATRRLARLEVPSSNAAVIRE